jgi:Protein of unknown function (DUF1573).
MSNSFAQKWAEDMFKIREYSFGSVSRNAKAEYDFVIYNPYIEDVHIRSVSSSCSCTTVSIDNATLKTYETAKVKAHYNTDKFVGSKSATITVVIDKPFYATVQLHVNGNIRSDILFQPGELNFGSVASGEAVEKNVDFSYLGRSNWQVREIKSSNPHVSAELTETSRNYGQVKYRLKIKLSPDAPAGYINDRIILVASEGYGTEIPFMVQGYVRSGITVSPSTLFVGNLEPGEKVVKRVVLRAENPFTIKEISCTNDKYSFDFAKLENETVAAKNIHIVSITFEAPESDSDKVFTDTIDIKTNIQEKSLVLPTSARVLPRSATVENSDEQPQTSVTVDSAATESANETMIGEPSGVLSRFNP